MLFRHFLSDLDNLHPRLNPWDEVNVSGLRLCVRGLELTLDETDTEAALGVAKETITELGDTIKGMEATDKEAGVKASELEHEVEALRNEMASLKDPSDEGSTVLTYRDRAIEAEKEAEECRERVKAFHRQHEEMKEELAAMRKRKGVEPGLMACSHDVWQFVSSLATDDRRYDKSPQDTLTRHKEDATKLRDKIASKV